LVIENNIFDARYADLSNLEYINKYEIKMENDVNSIVYHFVPVDVNSSLIIYHQGHAGNFFEGIDTIQFFLNHGYSVLAFSMPLLGMNSQPILESDFGNFKLNSHNHFFFLESDQFSPMRYFIEPIWVSLDYVEQTFYYDSFYMVGISGGGWTTTLYSTIDDRILEIYLIDGSLPIFLRSDQKNFGDYEQTNNDLYKLTNYLELYLMATSGDNRKFIQIFNKNDPCCFSGDVKNYYEKSIQNRLSQFGNGTF
jgi:pimeloyl-ACP methyl ester carboxylesterase